MWLLQCERCLNLTLSYHMLKWQQTSVIQILRFQNMQWSFRQASSWRLWMMHLLIMQMLHSCYACLGVFSGFNVHHIHFDCVNGFCMTCCNPTLRQVWGWDSHSQKWELGVLRDSQNFKTRLQGSKHLTLRCYLYRWKGLKVYISKMASHEPLGHLKHKLWSKEGSGVKLAVWLPTTKSWESTQPRCVQVECDTPLKSSWGEIQVCFRPHPNQRSELGVISSQSPGSPIWHSFKTPPWESRD
jgi:hypothetical protein